MRTLRVPALAALSAQGWTFWPLGVHAIAPQASTEPLYGPAGEAVVPGSPDLR